MNKQPAFRGKQQSARFTVKQQKCWVQYQIPKISAALRRLFGLASANTELSSVFTLKRLWIRVWKRWNTSKALGNRCRFTKGHHKDKQGDYNKKPRSAMHHTTPQQESTSCSGSRRLSTVHTVDALRNNPPPLELREFQVECTTESLYQLAFTQPSTQESTGRGQAESQTSLWKGRGGRTTATSQFIGNARGWSEVSISSFKRRFKLRTLFS